MHTHEDPTTVGNTATPTVFKELLSPISLSVTVSRPNVPVQSSQCDPPQMITATMRIPPNSVTIGKSNYERTSSIFN